MAKFFCNSNNGVMAVISEKHDTLFGVFLKAAKSAAVRGDIDFQKLYKDATDGGVRIFTFCPEGFLERYPESKHIFTGTYDDLKKLIEQGGHEIARIPSSNWTGYVPFSNHYESGAHGEEVKERELKYRTTLRDVMDAFGLQAVMTKAA